MSVMQECCLRRCVTGTHSSGECLHDIDIEWSRGAWWPGELIRRLCYSRTGLGRSFYMHATLSSSSCGPSPPLSTVSDVPWFPESNACIWPCHWFDSLPTDINDPASHECFVKYCTAVQCTLLRHHICISRCVPTLVVVSDAYPAVRLRRCTKCVLKCRFRWQCVASV